MKNTGPITIQRFDLDVANNLMMVEEEGEYVRFEDFGAVVDRLLSAVNSLELSEEQQEAFVAIINGQLS